MMSKRVASIVAVSCIALFGLTACGGFESTEPSVTEVQKESIVKSGYTKSSLVPLPDGRKVTCVEYNVGGYVGGISCDWATAK